MTDQTITYVCGFGRCGSSLVMAMLFRGGMDVYCDADTMGTSFETDKMPAWWLAKKMNKPFRS